MSPGLDPTAILLLWYDKVCVGLPNIVVLEHFPHSAGRPLITFNVGEISVL